MHLCNNKFKAKIVTVTPDYQTVNKQPVCYIKMMLLVNHGVIDYTQIIAPHENWAYVDASDSSARKQASIYYKISN